MKRDNIHHYIYLASLSLLAFATPLSNFMLSIGGILICANWIFSGNWQLKWQRLKEQPAAIWLSLFFFLCAIPLAYAAHLDVGFANLLNKLPFLYAPIILATSDPLSGKEQRAIANSFIIGVFIGTAASYIHYFTQPIKDIREISVFISHIRFSLCLDLAICFAIYMGIKVKSYPLSLRVGYLTLSAWFGTYLFFAQTLTGIVLLFLLLLFAFFYLLKSRQVVGRKLVSVVCVSVILIFATYCFTVIKSYYTPTDDETKIESHTANGNPYENDTSSIVESGHKINMYVCKKELQETWGQISNVPYDEMVEATAIRYLNSKGMRKDAAALASLSQQDIDNIEKGVANVDYINGFGIKRSLYPILFSISLYNHYGMMQYSTVFQRFELWKAGCAVCKKHFWFGVGLGDHKPAIDQQLDENQSALNYKRNMGAHNQFITYCLIGGVFLLLYFLVVLFIPFFTQKNSRNFLYMLFFIIVFCSLFMEDTLESQVGISLYAIFNAFLLFVYKKEQFEDSSVVITEQSNTENDENHKPEY
ncbi:O-antigen ligase family protein [Bacteroidales bacterium OttesenSCG-928-B11]|nr:O-antigen ligase family protein [Bacteroidales bacterium OttesenSCG-928-E04]MDL2309348.1 O-antigen ligase family protein [Bacteroidales bacterium OttesenSCG-928-C03]MDL2311551.1 O-antigen ligase family protein [Bacteroidales bacterium OttesenSCG-928-B11]MDL2325975.1 O-antigen ligase family protein [Bacteroidales bacterium OttesenSCG-928-A14]